MDYDDLLFDNPSLSVNQITHSSDIGNRAGGNRQGALAKPLR
jgi:hypothetical protein